MGTKTHTFHSKNPAQGIHNSVALGSTSSHNSIFVGVRTIFIASFIFSQHHLPIDLFIGDLTCLFIYKNRILLFYLEQDIRHKQRLIPTMKNKFRNYRQPSFRISGNYVCIHCYLIFVTVAITSVCLEEQQMAMATISWLVVALYFWVFPYFWGVKKTAGFHTSAIEMAVRIFSNTVFLDFWNQFITPPSPTGWAAYFGCCCLLWDTDNVCVCVCVCVCFFFVSSKEKIFVIILNNAADHSC